MLRSLYSGISALRAEQTALDVTGNNIANVNTVGFKSSSVQFETALSQTLATPGLATATKGGTNPVQVGLGVRVAAVATNTTQGAQQTTGNQTDEMISGDGYFVTTSNGLTSYTRDGSFHFDSSGRLSTADGGLVQGWTAQNGVVSTGSTPGNLTLTGGVAPAVATTSAALSGNLPSDASTAAGTSPFERDISVYDSSGNAKTLAVTFTVGSTPGTWSYSAVVRNADGTSGTPTTGTLTTAAGGTTTGTVGSSSANNVTPTVANGSSTISIDMSQLTGYAAVSTATVATQNGKAAGTMLSYTVGQDGVITGSFSNGSSITMGKIALATFNNPGGLTATGDSAWVASAASGTPTLNTSGSAGFGSIISGALEMSNVDLSQEFTNLIVAQRGFQAAARIITTSDQVLQDLVQLKQ